MANSSIPAWIRTWEISEKLTLEVGPLLTIGIMLIFIKYQSFFLICSNRNLFWTDIREYWDLLKKSQIAFKSISGKITLTIIFLFVAIETDSLWLDDFLEVGTLIQCTLMVSRGWHPLFLYYDLMVFRGGHPFIV